MEFDYTAAQWAGFSLVVLAIMLLIATRLRRRVPLLRSLFIPSAVISGFVILILGPQMLGAWTNTQGLIPEEVLRVWAVLPGLLINVVFASVMLGKTLPPLRQIWDTSAPHVIMGSAFSFGQFAIGALAVAFLLGPVFGMSEIAASIVELSFAGGHGTIAGMGSILVDKGAPELVDIGLGLATISMVTGIVGGSMLVRYAVSNPRIPVARTAGSPLTADTVPDLGEVPVAPVDHPKTEAGKDDIGIKPVTIAFMMIGVTIGVAMLILEGLNQLFLLFGSDLFDNFPLFPFTVIGGFIVQAVATKLKHDRHIDKRAVDGISAISLDVLIACAIGTMSLAALGANIWVLVILTVLSVAWSVLGMLYLGPLIHRKNWFEHAIADYGQSQGNVATGFVLADMADPQRTTNVANAYGYKQLTYEPLLGGGIISAFSVTVVAQWGALPFGIATALITVLLVVWGARRSGGSRAAAAQ
ncbi:MAG TPA: sodium/glutamate symporter [Arachnia sp.]|nr:sodium/glutamate symporter [Arachnia sp.]HMT84817.1 sodium/glutamate symporter [Arachnia sp.]